MATKTISMDWKKWEKILTYLKYFSKSIVIWKICILYYFIYLFLAKYYRGICYNNTDIVSIYYTPLVQQIILTNNQQNT